MVTRNSSLYKEGESQVHLVWQSGNKYSYKYGYEYGSKFAM